MFWLWLIFIALFGLGLLLSLVLASIYRREKPNHFVTAAWVCAAVFVFSLIGLPLYSTFHYASHEEALVNGAWEGNIAEVRAAVEDGTDVDAKDDNGSTALVLAASNGHAEIVKFLLARHADVNKSACRFARFDEQTPLQAAAKHPEIVKLLKNAGAKY